ncbi:MAG: RecB family exonuclease [Ilumatobacteraceae bacterium]
MFEVPQSLSPSRVESFLSCPMAFRFASIERLPEAPGVHSTKGSLVHRALELLFTHPHAERTLATAEGCYQQARTEYLVDPEFTLLGLDQAASDEFFADGWVLVQRYFQMEDPTAVRDIGLELRLEAQVGSLTLRGIIDRLELDADGRLVVTDYKTGRAPSTNYEQKSLAGVHFYSFLCTELFGQRPAAIRLMYLRSGQTITATPSDQSVRFLTTRTTAVWKAVEKACQTGDFRPKQGPLCNYCSFQSWCPAFGGDPQLAAVEAPLRFGTPTAA